jgi:hypothetical protein
MLADRQHLNTMQVREQNSVYGIGKQMFMEFSNVELWKEILSNQPGSHE